MKNTNHENYITIEILESDYLKIPKEVRDNMKIKSIEPNDCDYSENDNWVELNKKANSYYKKKKKLEFEIRKKENDL